MANEIAANNPTLNVSELARQDGVSRTTIQRRLAAGWTPPVILPPEPAAVTTVHRVTSAGRDRAAFDQLPLDGLQQ